MLAHLGPVADALRGEGLELIAPTAPRRVGAGELAGLLGWLRGAYAKRGQSVDAVFSEGTFWAGEGEHYDWFGSETVDGHKHFTALEAGLQVIREATQGRDVVGVLGFSQGCAMAALTAALAMRGDLPFGEQLRFSVLLSGFKPVFGRPVLDPWPVKGLPALLAWGREDAVFPDEATIRTLAAEFSNPELHLIDGLAHVVPQDPVWVGRIAAFVRRCLAAKT